MVTAPAIDPLDDTIGRGGVPRDGYGRAKLVPPGGGDRVPYTSMSTLAGVLGTDKAIQRWNERMVAKGVGMSREDSAIAGSSRYDTRIGEEDESRNREEGLILDEVIQRAKDRAGGTQKANWGTAFHRYAETDDPLGEPPLDMVGDLEAFRKALRKAGIQILDTEVFVVNEELGAAGSFDYLLSVPWRELLVIGDSKTGRKSLDKDEIQLAGYAGSVIYDRDTDERRTFAEVYGMEVDQEYGLTIRTAAMSGETELYPLDLTSGHESAKLAAAVHARNSRVQKYYRKVAPLDVDQIAIDRAWEALGRLTHDQSFAELSQRLKGLHAEFRDVWTAAMTDSGRYMLREAKTREAAA